MQLPARPLSIPGREHCVQQLPARFFLPLLPGSRVRYRWSFGFWGDPCTPRAPRPGAARFIFPMLARAWSMLARTAMRIHSREYPTLAKSLTSTSVSDFANSTWARICSVCYPKLPGVSVEAFSPHGEQALRRTGEKPSTLAWLAFCEGSTAPSGRGGRFRYISQDSSCGLAYCRLSLLSFQVCLKSASYARVSDWTRCCC